MGLLEQRADRLITRRPAGSLIVCRFMGETPQIGQGRADVRQRKFAKVCVVGRLPKDDRDLGDHARQGLGGRRGNLGQQGVGLSASSRSIVPAGRGQHQPPPRPMCRSAPRSKSPSSACCCRTQETSIAM